jgi:hypothetical protein
MVPPQSAVFTQCSPAADGVGDGHCPSRLCIAYIIPLPVSCPRGILCLWPVSHIARCYARDQPEYENRYFIDTFITDGHLSSTLLHVQKGLPPNRLGVLRTKKKKVVKKRGKLRDLVVGFENKDTSKFEVGKCYEVLFFFPFFNGKKFSAR